ncbi:MAG: translocation/assembly module TamB domain-containing protein [Phyllobacteriaceae bacterium]|nr:translocation/assembly module TamB domain-containing protein [Phyllobacteriaceae bacterium]
MTIKAKTTLAALSVALMASTAHAGGLDRTTYSPNILFEQGKVYIEGSLARVNPDVDGDLVFPGAIPLPAVNGVDDMSPNYGLWSIGAKIDLSDRVAVAFQTFEAVGADIDFGAPPNFYTNLSAYVTGRAYVGTAKFSLNDNFSVFGGIKHLEVSGVATSFYGAGESWELNGAHGTGYIAGIAYEKKEIALRVSLTYESSIDIDMDTSRSGGFVFIPPAGPVVNLANVTGTTTATIPEAWELYFQTGIAPGTLLFGSVRHTSWSDANIVLLNDPSNDSNNVTDFSDSLTWNLGVGKQLTDRLSMSVSGTYEAGDGKPSTLQPVDGKFTLGVGAKYKLTENLEISGGISHTWLGDNETDTGAPVEGQFEDNHAWAFGTKIALRF